MFGTCGDEIQHDMGKQNWTQPRTDQGRFCSCNLLGRCSDAVLYFCVAVIQITKRSTCHVFSERLLAEQNPLSQADQPHQLFADAPPPPAAPPGGAGLQPPPPPPSSVGPPPGHGHGHGGCTYTHTHTHTHALNCEQSVAHSKTQNTHTSGGAWKRPFEKG